MRYLEVEMPADQVNDRIKRVSDVLVQAVERLVGQPEHDAAAAVKEDFPLCTDTLEARCAELPHLLETTQYSSTMLAWSV